ncbi:MULTISPECIES: cell division protein ZipA [Microbulbifer]|uniref:cell division protein ZipA n=1 Tax=Microbulbifer TaxID=48073 RepID=UPI001E2C2826|nr:MULTISPECIES: cell division protein ZipA [Microbulbifer]UHQ55996.1 cell division protein ZipA [Microbulbifer sp. YPW16]
MDNWLITILALVLVLALVDGVRRAILRHRDADRTADSLSRAMHGNRNTPSTPARPGRATADEDDFLDPEEAAKRAQIARELPGSVRVVQRRALEDALQVNRKLQEGFQTGRRPAEANKQQQSEAEPQQASLNLEEQVPTLMDSFADAAEEAIGEDFRREPELDEADSLQALSETEQEERGEPVLKKKKPPEPVSGGSETMRQSGNTRGGSRHDRHQADGADKSPVEEVLIINIMAREGDLFEGNDLLRALMAVNMRFGDMDIFHYHLGGSDDGPVIFSLANMVVPGVFDLGRMEEFATPGVSLFLALPIDGEAIKAFELMLSVSREIAEQLGGELKDENRSVFTAQTAEHYRQRVMEYQRRRALARAQA